MKTFRVKNYTNWAPQKCFGRTDGQTDEGQMNRRSGPITRPAFALEAGYKDDIYKNS